jgi:cytochrome P450
LNHSNIKEPREFNPLRYRSEDTAVEQNGISAESTKRYHFTFGAGRRVCPGYHVAQRGLFIAISRMIWGFKFSHRQDKAGKRIPIDHDALTKGVIVQPALFQ